MNINNYKYDIFIDKINFTNLYLIYKIVSNVKYYLVFETNNDDNYYLWKKQELFKDYSIINKALYINPVSLLTTQPNSINVIINQRHTIFSNLFYIYNKYFNNTNSI